MSARVDFGLDEVELRGVQEDTRMDELGWCPCFEGCLWGSEVNRGAVGKCNEVASEECCQICLEKHFDGYAAGLEGCASGLDGCASVLEGCASGLDRCASGPETSLVAFLEPAYIDGPYALPPNDKNMADGRVRSARLVNTTLFADATNIFST